MPAQKLDQKCLEQNSLVILNRRKAYTSKKSKSVFVNLDAKIVEIYIDFFPPSSVFLTTELSESGIYIHIWYHGWEDVELTRFYSYQSWSPMSTLKIWKIMIINI